MKKFILFIKTLVKQALEDDIISLSFQLTYKLMLAVFPFIIFLMTILGYLNIDGNELIVQIADSVPEQVMKLFTTFVDEVILERNISILSTSLIVSIYSSSSGFYAMIRGVNKSYRQEETRNFLTVRLISVALVFVFTLVIILSIALLIFRNRLLSLINYYFTPTYFMLRLFDIAGLLTALFLILLSVSLIYKMSSCKKVKFINVLPGSLVTLTCFSIVSKAFGIYIDNFARYSVIYGSIGSIFILLIWLNLLSIILLIGSEINALLDVRDSFRRTA